MKIWVDVGRVGLDQADTVVGFKKPVAVRCRGQICPITTWKEGTVKLVEMFEAAQPGLLGSIVVKGDLASELSADPDRFPRSKVSIGGVYFNTHASVHELKRRLKKIALHASIGDKEYAFVFAKDATPLAECEHNEV